MGKLDGAHSHGSSVKLSAGGVGLIVVAVIALVYWRTITAIGVMLAHALMVLGLLTVVAGVLLAYRWLVQRPAVDERQERAAQEGIRENIGVRQLAGYRPPAGEIEAPGATHHHQHFYFGDAESAAAVIRALQDQREARP
jgi:uncharacterized SAM-binding protein YcdF (DUF218 family)